MGGPNSSAGGFGTQTAAGGWQPSPNPTPQAPVGTPGGNALLDWLGAGNMPSIPNPSTFGQFFAGGGAGTGANGSGGAGGGALPTSGYHGGPMPPAGFVPTPQQPFPTAGTPPTPRLLQNPDIGTFGGGTGSVGRPAPVRPGSIALPGMKAGSGKF